MHRRGVRQQARYRAGQRVVWEEDRSVKLCGIRPAREAGDGVELFQQLAHDLRGIIFCAELVQMAKHQRERMIGVRDRTFREILSLLLETFAMAIELLAIEVGNQTDRGAQNPIRADNACHATPRVRHWKDKTSVERTQSAVKRDSMRPRGDYRERTPRATINPPRQPSSMPPATINSPRFHGKNVIAPSPTACAACPPNRAFAAVNANQSNNIATSAPAPPCRTPSTTKGPRTYSSGAPTSVMISISSSRADAAS